MAGWGDNMPFKSKAQRRKFAELLVKGEISPETYEEWNRSTGRKELPERVKPKKKKTRARKAAESARKRAPNKPTLKKRAVKEGKVRARKASRRD